MLTVRALGTSRPLSNVMNPAQLLPVRFESHKIVSQLSTEEHHFA